MTAPDFLDTNVLVYAYGATESAKRRVAQSLVRRALAGEIIISSQVLAEFATTLLRKATPVARPDEVMEILDILAPIKLVVPTGSLIKRAVEAHATYGIQFYDGLIVASAELGGCERIWSEDLNPGQRYFGVWVINPFQ